MKGLCCAFTITDLSAVHVDHPQVQASAVQVDHPQVQASAVQVDHPQVQVSAVQVDHPQVQVSAVHVDDPQVYVLEVLLVEVELLPLQASLNLIKKPNSFILPVLKQIKHKFNCLSKTYVFLKTYSY